MKVSILNSEEAVINAMTLAVGEVGKVVGDSYRGSLVLQTYSGLVDLRNPMRTWSKHNPCSLTVQRLPKGTKLVLEITDLNEADEGDGL